MFDDRLIYFCMLHHFSALTQHRQLSSFVHGRYGRNFKNVILKNIFPGTSCEIALRWMPQNIFEDKSTLCAWTNVDLDLCSHTVSLGHNEINSPSKQETSYYIIISIMTAVALATQGSKSSAGLLLNYNNINKNWKLYLGEQELNSDGFLQNMISCANCWRNNFCGDATNIS